MAATSFAALPSRKEQRKAARQAKKQQKNVYYQNRSKGRLPQPASAQPYKASGQMVKKTLVTKTLSKPNSRPAQASKAAAPSVSHDKKRKAGFSDEEIASEDDEEIASDSDAYESYSESSDSSSAADVASGSEEDPFMAMIDDAFSSGKLTKDGLLRDNGKLEDSDFEGNEDEDEDEEVEEDYVEDEDDVEEEEDDAVVEEDDDKDTRNKSTSKLASSEGLASSSKAYIPPAKKLKQQLEQKPTVDMTDESTLRLNKQLQSLVNKLSAANLIPMTTELENLLRANRRKVVIELLTELLLASIIRPGGNLLDSFAINFAGLASITAHVVGNEFGAHLVEKVIESIDSLYAKALSTSPAFSAEEKTAIERSLVNCMTFCSYLYDLQVISSRLVCDLMQQSSRTLHEIDVEVILKLFRSCGAQIRRDEPEFLPTLVDAVQERALAIPPAQQSSRFRFMLETLLELKDSKRKLVEAIPPELEAMKKSLRALMAQKSLAKLAPLRVSLDDVRNIETKGKWWLIGSSWHPDQEAAQETAHQAQPASTANQEAAKIDALARAQRMNTTTRRAIFAALMASEDEADAFDRLVALKLPGKQERDIVLVLLHCCGQERTFNPFYALVAAKLALFKRPFLMTLQYALWDVLKQLDDCPLRKLANLARLYGQLLAVGCVPLSAFRKGNFVRLSESEAAFWQLLFMTAFTQQGSTAVLMGLAEAFVTSIGTGQSELGGLGHPKTASSDSFKQQPQILTANVDMAEFDDDFFAAQAKLPTGSHHMSSEKLEECKALRSGLAYLLDAYFLNATEFPFASSLVEGCRKEARKLKLALAME